LVTNAVEDYLAIIYKLISEGEQPTTTLIAEKMDVSKASVTDMFKKMAKASLITHEPYKIVKLTKAGERIALEVIRHHRLVELYLQEAMGVSWDKVHDEASEYLKQKSAERPITSSPEALYDYLKHSMSGLDKEVFKAVYLDAKNKIIEVVDLFEGTVDTSVVYLRETIKNALNHNAVSIIFAHNHLSGDTKPSQDDKNITQELIMLAS